jgi:hypothetical protein
MKRQSVPHYYLFISPLGDKDCVNKAALRLVCLAVVCGLLVAVMV